MCIVVHLYLEVFIIKLTDLFALTCMLIYRTLNLFTILCFYGISEDYINLFTHPKVHNPNP